MNVLVLGGGGREHALYTKLSESEHIKQLFATPGNGGIDPKNRFPGIHPEDFESLAKLIQEKSLDVLLVGPEQPLATGIVDYFAKLMPQLLVFGPTRHMAQLEASKIFAANFMKEADLPVCRSEAANTLESAENLLSTFSTPVVIKADGLAAGKGVSIHSDKGSAKEKLVELFQKKALGKAGSKILIQEYMTGTEASLFVLMNGNEAIFLPTAQDYKRSHDNDTGLNTGGMGSISPGTALNKNHLDSISTNVLPKILKKFRYRGLLYIGPMVHSQEKDDYSIIEFNCRFGDPETQCILPMLEPDLFPYILWTCGKEISPPLRVKVQNHYQIPTKPGFSMNVVLAAEGYPGAFEKGIFLKLPETLPGGVNIIHAGTEREGNQLFSNGGRILNVVGHGKNKQEVRKNVYTLMEEIYQMSDSKKLRFRTDIGV